MNNYDSIVVGGGISGLLSALVLSKSGKKVLVLERKKFLGGLSSEFDEFNYVGSEVWFKKKAFWAMPISNYNRNFVPGGKKLVGFMFSIDENNNPEYEKGSAYDTILRVYPGIDKYIDMVHYQVTTPEKAAVSITGFIADTQTPIKNLYIVGTDADDRSMGVTRAAYSVVKLIKVLKHSGYID